jgi:Reverse transcriptase (RNA-dependent DNA polymerase)
LNQSPQVWYEKSNSYLISYNFRSRSADHSLFVKHYHTYITIALVYVDDIIIIGNNSIQIREVKGKCIFTWMSLPLTKEAYVRLVKRD